MVASPFIKRGGGVRKNLGSIEIAEVGKRLDKARDNAHIDSAIFKWFQLGFKL